MSKIGAVAIDGMDSECERSGDDRAATLTDGEKLIWAAVFAHRLEKDGAIKRAKKAFAFVCVLRDANAHEWVSLSVDERAMVAAMLDAGS